MYYEFVSSMDRYFVAVDWSEAFAAAAVLVEEAALEMYQWVSVVVVEDENRLDTD